MSAGLAVQLPACCSGSGRSGCAGMPLQHAKSVNHEYVFNIYDSWAAIDLHHVVWTAAVCSTPSHLGSTQTECQMCCTQGC